MNARAKKKRDFHSTRCRFREMKKIFINSADNGERPLLPRGWPPRSSLNTGNFKMLFIAGQPEIHFSILWTPDSSINC